MITLTTRIEVLSARQADAQPGDDREPITFVTFIDAAGRPQNGWVAAEAVALGGTLDRGLYDVDLSVYVKRGSTKQSYRVAAYQPAA